MTKPTKEFSERTGKLVIRQVWNLTDPAIDDIVRIFKEAFSEPPYFESYTDSEVMSKIVLPHINHWLAVAELDGVVIGMIAARATTSPESEEECGYLMQQNLPFDLETSVYCSELAVDPNVRKGGLGSKLTAATLAWGVSEGFETFICRTDSDGSNSIRLLERIGWQRLPLVQDVAGQTDGGSASESRVWLSYDANTNEFPPTENLILKSDHVNTFHDDSANGANDRKVNVACALATVASLLGALYGLVAWLT